MPLVVVVVPQGGVLELRVQRLQQAVALQVTDKNVTAVVEEALRAQRLEDQALDLGLGVSAVLVLVDGRGDLEGHRGLLLEGLAQHHPGTRLQEIQVADGGVHLGLQAVVEALLLGLLEALGDLAIFGEADPQQAPRQRQGEYDHHDQCSGEMVALQVAVGELEFHRVA